MRKYKIFVTDVDGVLTDGKINYLTPLGREGEVWELKNFNAKDGSVLKKMEQEGIVVVFLSGRKSAVVEYRARELGIKEVHLGIDDKFPYLEEILKKYQFDWDEVVYVGDDIPDLKCMEEAGLACCPADAVEQIKSVSVFVTSSRGGEGVIREVVERYTYELGL